MLMGTFTLNPQNRPFRNIPDSIPKPGDIGSKICGPSCETWSLPLRRIEWAELTDFEPLTRGQDKTILSARLGGRAVIVKAASWDLLTPDSAMRIERELFHEVGNLRFISKLDYIFDILPPLSYPHLYLFIFL